MITVHSFTFNPFSENTYLLVDEEQNGILIDPGMYFPQENTRFFEFINKEGIKLQQLLLTHAHLDHVFGVNWASKSFGLTPRLNADDDFIYTNAANTARQYGLQMEDLVPCTSDLIDGDVIPFDGTNLTIVKAPGHSPGSVCFYCERDAFLIGGDVLFQGSIGRTDLPGGNYDTLMTSIHSRILVLPDEVVVHSGHGPLTTVGQERQSNPFLVS